MKTVSADFNALTEDGDIRLTCRASRDDLKQMGLKPSDWAWLSDGEVLFGARLERDARWGMVGQLRWDTLVRFDDPDVENPLAIRDQLNRLIPDTKHDHDTEFQIFRLMTVYERRLGPLVVSRLAPGIFPLRRAMALQFMKEPELALIEMEAARQARPNDADLEYFYLEFLRRADPIRAVQEATDLLQTADIPASVLAGCIDIFASEADQFHDDAFARIGSQILRWCDQFERAPGRTRVRPAIAAQLYFNRGITLLRLDRLPDARRALDQAQAANPNEPLIHAAQKLNRYDEEGRLISMQLHSKPSLPLSTPSLPNFPPSEPLVQRA